MNNGDYKIMFRGSNRERCLFQKQPRHPLQKVSKYIILEKWLLKRMHNDFHWSTDMLYLFDMSSLW